MKQHYHFIGIGGIGMGALATLLLEKGFQVSGSDVKENYMTAALKEKGAVIHIGHDAKNLGDAQFVVYSSAINEENPEIVEARKKSLPILQRAKLLANLMREHEGITVAGAHGKTTTTSMTANLLLKAGLNPTTAVGGIVGGTKSNARLGDGKYFVSEVDESDGSFLYFTPKYSIITNVDYEHLDFYKNWDAILNAYREFIGRTQKDGMLFFCAEDKNLVDMMKSSPVPFQSYGFSSNSNICASNIQFDNFSSSYDCLVNGKAIGRIELKVPGKHNILNSLACVGLGLKLQIPFSTIQQSLLEFKEVKRRFQLLADVKGIKVVDDYAHHPTEIKATLDAAARVHKKRLVTVFQPHRYTRLQSLFKEFAQSLKEVDYLIVMDVYAASESPIAGVDAKTFIAHMKDISKNQIVYVKKEDIINHLHKMAVDGDLIMMLGAGDITKLAHDFADQLLTASTHQTTGKL
jgi:UDP-N-acetylmuramate--alanine ligase